MPLRLKAPRKGKSPNYTIRGSYLRVHVDCTAGTPNRKTAGQVRDGIMRAIERGDYRQPQTPEPVAPTMPPTFADAALAYLRANGDPKGLRDIIEATGQYALRDKPLGEIDQMAIDNAGRALHPDAKATTLNRQFYTPVSAVLKRAGIERKIKRPKGWRGSKATSWLDPAPAFRVIEQAYAIEYEFGLLCETYLFTGMRLSEPLRAKVRDLRLDMVDKTGQPSPLLYVPDSKNGDPRPVHLTPHLASAYRNTPPRMGRPRKGAGAVLANGAAGRSRRDSGVPWLERRPDEKLFRFAAGGRLRTMLKLAMARAGVSFPARQGGFHLFCHTYGTWMTNFGGLDNYGLVRTRRWKDPDSADRYNHTMATPEAKRADVLPVPKKRKAG